MKMTRDEVLELLTTELRAAGYQPTAAQAARMRSFLAELDVASGAKDTARLAPRMAAHRPQPSMFVVQRHAPSGILVRGGDR